jgi:hypothetical protein
MVVNPKIECFWRDPIHEYCHGLESSVLYTAPPLLVESLHGCPNGSLPHVPLHLHGEKIIPIVFTSNILIGWCHSNSCALARHWSYYMFKFLLIVRINQWVGLWGILNFPLLRDVFPYRLAGGFPLKDGVPYHVRSKVRPLPRYLRWKILGLEISLNSWLPPSRHSDGP